MSDRIKIDGFISAAALQSPFLNAMYTLHEVYAMAGQESQQSKNKDREKLVHSCA